MLSFLSTLHKPSNNGWKPGRFFWHKNQACSPALSDVESLYLGTKGDLLMSFQEISDAKSRKSTTTRSVLDGAAIEQILKPAVCKNFRKDAQKIFSHMSLQDVSIHHVLAGLATPTLLTHSDLVQEQNMEKKCADAWLQTRSSPEIGRTFSE
jgi:hypothetical protein